LRNPANRRRAISLTREQFRYGFGNARSAAESAELHERWTVPSPRKPLLEAASANRSPRSPAKVNTRNETRGPLLLIAGGNDHTVPAAITKSTRKQDRTSSAVSEYKEFPDRGHSLTIDHGWREIADAVLTWLKQYAPAKPRPPREETSARESREKVSQRTTAPTRNSSRGRA
jgi:pimeloyl-ACP methyl ester carboxylesterase